MAKANVIQLVNDISLNQADTTIIEGYYTDAVFELARLGFFATLTLVEVTKDTGVYPFPTDATRVLDAFWDDDVLSRETVNSLQAESVVWRDARGRPRAYTEESENARNLRLFPVPNVSSKNFSFLFGAPMGMDFPEYSLGLLINETRLDVQDYLDLTLAFMILSKEYLRESDHTDFRMAGLCKQMAEFLTGVI